MCMHFLHTTRFAVNVMLAKDEFVPQELKIEKHKNQKLKGASNWENSRSCKGGFTKYALLNSDYSITS